MEALLQYGALGLFALVLIAEHLWLIRHAIPALLARHAAERERDREAFIGALMEIAAKNEAAHQDVCRRLEWIHEDLVRLHRVRDAA